MNISDPSTSLWHPTRIAFCYKMRKKARSIPVQAQHYSRDVAIYRSRYGFIRIWPKSRGSRISHTWNKWRKSLSTWKSMQNSHSSLAPLAVFKSKIKRHFTCSHSQKCRAREITRLWLASEQENVSVHNYTISRDSPYQTNSCITGRTHPPPVTPQESKKVQTPKT